MSEAKAAPRDEVVQTYMSSRVIHAKKPACILVDAFRFAERYQSILSSRWSSDNNHHRVKGISGKGASAASSRLPVDLKLCVFYFLSHFHSDHYTGISAGWCHGRIYTTRETAALVRSQLGVSAERIFILDWGTCYTFSMAGDCIDSYNTNMCGSSRGRVLAPGSFSVRLIPANHCPGAAMFVFQSPDFGCVLHTGDFRFNNSSLGWRNAISGRKTFFPCLGDSDGEDALGGMAQTSQAQLEVPFYEQFIADNEGLSAIVGKVDRLFLDNTFCDPVFHFPSQWDATQLVVEMLRSLCLRAEGKAIDSRRRVVRCAAVVGTYTIGKERVAFAIQEAFHAHVSGERCPIHVSSAKYSLLRAMNFHVDRFQPLPITKTPQSCDGEVGDVTGSSGRQAIRLGGTCVTLPKPRYPSHDENGAALSCVSRALFSGADESEQPVVETECMLDIVLVPFASATYPALAKANGLSKREREASDEADAAQAQLSDVTARKNELDMGDCPPLDLSEYDTVLAVEPTGWTKKPHSRLVAGHTWLLRLPYSEHSSFKELVDFVALVNPQRVIPTVSVEQFAAHEALFVERAPRLASRYSNTQPLSRFFSKLSAAPCHSSNNGKCSEEPAAEEVIAKHEESCKPSNPFSSGVNSSSAVVVKEEPARQWRCEIVVEEEIEEEVREAAEPHVIVISDDDDL